MYKHLQVPGLQQVLIKFIYMSYMSCCVCVCV